MLKISKKIYGILCVLAISIVILITGIWLVVHNNNSAYPNDCALNAQISDEYMNLSQDCKKIALQEFFALENAVYPTLENQGSFTTSWTKYLEYWASRNNIHLNSCNNQLLYFDIPATKGKENSSRAIVTATMDICETFSQNKLSDTWLNINEDEGWVKGNGNTKMCSKNAVSIATAISLTKNLGIEHPAIRFIFKEKSIPINDEITKIFFNYQYVIDLSSADYVGNVNVIFPGNIKEESKNLINAIYDKACGLSTNINISKDIFWNALCENNKKICYVGLGPDIENENLVDEIFYTNTMDKYISAVILLLFSI